VINRTIIVPTAEREAEEPPAPLPEADYFVSKVDGNDSYNGLYDTFQGSLDGPKATIQGGLNALTSAGDILEILAGKYVEYLDLSGIPSGTSWDNATTIRARSGDSVEVEPPFTAVSKNGTLIGNNTIGPSWVIIDGIEFDGRYVNAANVKINDPSHHIRIQNCEIHHGATEAGLLGPDDGVPYSPLLPTNAGGQGILDTSDASAGFNEAINCHIHHNGWNPQFDHGLYIYGNDFLCQGNIIEYNRGTGGQFRKTGASTFRPRVIGNIFRFNGDRTWSNLKNACILNTTDGYCINNISYKNAGVGISDDNYDGTRVYNNTCWGNGEEGIHLGGNGGGDYICKNNIAYANCEVSGSQQILDESTPASVVSNNTTTNPNFADPNNGDFHISTGSAAENAGVNLISEGVTDDFDGVTRPASGAFDNGAYEVT
jgi:hypothetical protein